MASSGERWHQKEIPNQIKQLQSACQNHEDLQFPRVIERKEQNGQHAAYDVPNIPEAAVAADLSDGQGATKPQLRCTCY